jgi:hypothetical protein
MKQKVLIATEDILVVMGSGLICKLIGKIGVV